MQTECLDRHPLQELVVLVMIVENVEQLKTIIYQKGHEFERAGKHIYISVYSIRNDQIMLSVVGSIPAWMEDYESSVCLKIKIKKNIQLIMFNSLIFSPTEMVSFNPVSNFIS